MGKKDKFSAKKNRVPEASGNSSNLLLIENLKTVNACLAKDVAECRREIERLRVHLTSLIDEKDIFQGIQHDVFALVISSSLHEYASRATTDMTLASNRERNLLKKIETIAKKINTQDIELLVLAKEKEEMEKGLVMLKENIKSIEQQTSVENEDGICFAMLLLRCLL